MSTAHPTSGNPKYSWTEHGQQDLPKRPAADRVADFRDIHASFDESAAQEQASRCIQCPHPRCVTGCPLGSPIQDWIQLTAEGRFLEAAALAGCSGAIPEICARVCPADRLCEANCVVGGPSEPVSIGAVEQFLQDFALAHGQEPAVAAPNGYRVAVAGAGPGGLACADELSRRGYEVTVFDGDLVPGGLLLHGTAAFRLERGVVENRVELLRRRGVVFRLGEEVGEDVSLADLREDFDVVYLGLDARQARGLEVPGVELPGVVQGVAFLLRELQGEMLEGMFPDLTGKRVAVIGCGDTAMDCLRTAIRRGAGEALCVYRRDEANMPCSHREYVDALEEGVQFHFRSQPVEVLAGPEGRVRALRLVRTVVDPGQRGADGRQLFRAERGTEFELPVDWVILALGFDLPPGMVSAEFAEVTTHPEGTIVVDASRMTSVPGVFAGGDIVRGPCDVVHAVHDARLAANGIDAFLGRPASSSVAG